MAISKAEVKRIIQAIGILSADGAHFQFPTLREKLGISADEKLRAAYTHNLLKELLNRAVLEVVSGDRQRNRYYRVKSEWKLRAFAKPAGPFSYFYDAKSDRQRISSKVVNIPKVQVSNVTKTENISPIEDGLQKISARLENIESVLNELRAIWK